MGMEHEEGCYESAMDFRLGFRFSAILFCVAAFETVGRMPTKGIEAGTWKGNLEKALQIAKEGEGKNAAFASGVRS